MSFVTSIRRWLGRRGRNRSAIELVHSGLNLEELERRDVPSTLQLDLGTGSSPVYPAYVNVPLGAFTPQAGLGWQDVTNLQAIDDGFGSALTRDYHLGHSEATFSVDLANGTYDVLATMGSFQYSQDRIDVWAEGDRVASNLSTSAYVRRNVSFEADVADGRLDLRFVDRGGASNRFFLNSLKITLVSAPPPPQEPVKVTINDVTIGERDGGTTPAVFTIRLSRPSDVTVRVDYATANGIATLFDQDYDNASGTLTFSPGVTSRTIAVNVHGDLKAESDESFFVNLSNPVNAELLDAQGRGVIVNDESQSIIAIDADWLAERGDASYVLDQAGATYVLNTDVNVRTTAFVVGAADVTFDLNGHQVTFGNSQPVAVVNGGFEQGSGRSVPGWDLSGAPAASIASNTSFLFGDQVLRLSSMTTTQRIVSTITSIPEANRPYAATITPANPDANVTLKVSVVDVATNTVLGSGTSSSAFRGFSAVAHFIPTTTNPVRLVIEVTPKTSGTSVDLDAATLSFAGDYGIVATRQWGGAIPGWPNFSPEAQQHYRKAANFTVKNGIVIQGAGQAFGSSALYLRSLAGITVDNVVTLVNGMDSMTVEGTYAKSDVTIRNSHFTEQIENVSNRFLSFSTIKLLLADASIVIQNNVIVGSPQVGIDVDRNAPGNSVLIDGNEIRQNSIVTNAYAISLSAVESFVVSNNRIQPANGRGIIVDGFSSQPSLNGEIVGNYVDVQEGFNREYPQSIQARALRLRNNIDGMGAHRNLYVHDNTFIARTSSNLAEHAEGVRISYANKNGAMDDANVVLEGNLIAAFVDANDPTRSAEALILDRVDPGIHLLLIDNVLQSNDVSLAVADAGGDVLDVTMIGTVLSKRADGFGRPYLAIRAGYWIREIHNVRLLGTSVENSSALSIRWIGPGLKDLEFGWLLHVRVVDGLGNALSGSQVTVRDRVGTIVATGTTGDQGWLRDLQVITTVYRQTTSRPFVIRIESNNPHSVTASFGGKSVSLAISLTAELELTLPIL